MIIAVPVRNGLVDDHFYHCEYFVVFSVNREKEIVHEDYIPLPSDVSEKPNIAKMLFDMEVEVVLAGNIGESAFNDITNFGIEVVRDCFGKIEEVIEQWILNNC